MKRRETHGWDLASLEGRCNSVPLKLAINISLLLLDIGRSIDLCRRHDDESKWVSPNKKKEKAALSSLESDSQD